MFKHYITFEKAIRYNFLYEQGIVNGYIQCPIQIKKEDLEKIICEGNSKNMFEIM